MAVQGESCCRPALISSCCLWWRASCTSELTGLFNKLLVLFQHFILSRMRPHENKTDMLTCISSCVIRAHSMSPKWSTIHEFLCGAVFSGGCSQRPGIPTLWITHVQASAWHAGTAPWWALQIQQQSPFSATLSNSKLAGVSLASAFSSCCSYFSICTAEEPSEPPSLWSPQVWLLIVKKNELLFKKENQNWWFICGTLFVFLWRNAGSGKQR